MRLNQEQKAALREVFRDRPDSPCGDCGGYHLRRACPRVKRQVHIGQGAGEGNRVEVEYWETWDESFTAYPEDVWDPGEEGDE
jgi:hypothetical protein